MKRFYYTIVGILGISILSYGQSNSRNYGSYLHDGYFGHFEVGIPVADKVIYGKTLLSTYTNQIFQPEGAFYYPYFYYDTINRLVDTKISSCFIYSGEIIETGEVIRRKFKDALYFTIGGVNSKSLKQARRLAYNQEFGRPNLSNATHLSMLVINSYFEVPLSKRNPNTHFEYTHTYFDYTDARYIGDPFLWQSVVKLNKVSRLQINIGSDLNESHYRDYSSVDIPLDEVFSMPNLEQVRLEKADYLPVNFNLYEKFDAFYVTHGNGPEILNLALIFHHFGKDSTLNRWGDLLQWVTISDDFNIPTDGLYQTFYKDGVPLCSGSFANGLPDGKWLFWYEDGALSQSRHYNQGKRTGEWYTLSEVLYRSNRQDTLHIRQFDNDQLVNYKASQEHYYHICSNREISYLSKKMVEFDITHFGPDSVLFKRTYFEIGVKDKRSYHNYEGDTLMSISSEWSGNLEDWEFSSWYRCYDNREGIKREYKGDIGELPYFSHQEEYYKRRTSLRWDSTYFETYLREANFSEGYYLETYIDSRGLPTPDNRTDSVYTVLPTYLIYGKP